MIKIVIVEDHTLFREGLKSLLAHIPDFEIVAEYANGKDFCDQLTEIDAQIVLMDIEMPVMGGIEASGIVNIKRPELQIIALSMYGDQCYYYEMIRVGISGFVLKGATTTELEKAIRDVNSGLGFFSPTLLHSAIVNSNKLDSKKNRFEKLQLTDREIQVLDLICKGMTNAEISEKLFLSPKTVESHKSKLFQKTDTRNTAGLVIYAIKNELIEI